MQTITSYNPLPISFTHGKGCWLYDKANNAYLDAFSGIAVTGLGHAHPEITKTIQTQSALLIHTSNAFIIEQQDELAKKLTQKTNMEQAFFCNSGAEANEAAIKLTRLYGHHKNINNPEIIVMDKAFHGRTMATLSASGSRKVQAGFEPLLSGFIRAPFNDINALHNIAKQRDNVVAVMIEPIQGESGIHPAEESYLINLAKLCKEKNWLLIFDEVQTGNGRTGKLFAFEQTGIQPDILTTAKGLGNGFPIGACLMRNNACDLFKPGNHGSTFGGNPLACAVASTVLDVIETENLCQKVSENSLVLHQLLHDLMQKYEEIVAVRGKGYMIGIELNQPASDIRNIALEYGLLVNVTAEKVVRLLPPLILQESEIDMLYTRFKATFDKFLRKTTTSS